MNRAEKRRQKKLAKKATRKGKPGQPNPAIDQSLTLAVQHHTAGDLGKAEALYQQILQADANHPVALHLLGVIAHQVGKIDLAVERITQALAAKPDYAEAHSNLGNAFKDLGRLEEAVASYRQALTIKPDFADAHNNLGNALKIMGLMDEAAASYHDALAINPAYAEAHSNLGNAFNDMGKPEKAVASYRQALAIKPDYADAHINLGNALKDMELFDEAAASYQKALAINPDHAEAHNNLGNVFRELGKLDEAIASYHKTLAIRPGYAEAHSNIGHTFKDFGKLDEAVESYRKALAIKPDLSGAHSNLLLTEQYRLGHNAQTLYQLHLDWDDHHGRGFRATWPKHANNADPDRRLRVGFVSPDLGRHPVGYFIVGLLENLPKQQIESVCYSDRLEDDLTLRIKAATDLWRDVHGFSDARLMKTILTDEIDILFDLSGHSAKNRLLVFAQKPAPVQVSWAGYIGTTGLAAMDYLLSDTYSTRADEEQYYTEKILRMPAGWLCYDPVSYAPPVGPCPFKRHGYVTFASFSNGAKINSEVVSVWAKILHGVAESRLLLKYKNLDSAANAGPIIALFEEAGINPSRIILEGQSPHAALLERYNDVDIALDPFPYSGGLTTYEALWMGVPVITVAGETFASRHSLSHLSTVGLPELVAGDQGDYVKLAVELAGDADRLSDLRLGLRQKMAASPICDGEKFASGFAAIMRQIWGHWCNQQNLS